MTLQEELEYILARKERAESTCRFAQGQDSNQQLVGGIIEAMLIHADLLALQCRALVEGNTATSVTAPVDTPKNIPVIEVAKALAYLWLDFNEITKPGSLDNMTRQGAQYSQSALRTVATLLEITHEFEQALEETK